MRPKGGAHDFEDWLDRELQRTLGSVRGPSRQPSRAVYAAAPSGGALMAIKAKVVAALTTRAAAGVAAAAVALGGGVVAASAATGGTHPWVSKCQSGLSTASRKCGPIHPVRRAMSVSA
jgi:hypothetical protein